MIEWPAPASSQNGAPKSSQGSPGQALRAKGFTIVHRTARGRSRGHWIVKQGSRGKPFATERR